MLRSLLLTTLIISMMMLSGCTGSQDCDVQQGSGQQKVVCNGTVFTYTLQGSQSLVTDQYSWENSGEKAYVSAVFQGSGTVYVTIKDHNGVQVYSQQHTGSGQTVGARASEAGESGTWTIKIETRSLQGQVVVEVHRNAP